MKGRDEGLEGWMRTIIKVRMILESNIQKDYIELDVLAGSEVASSLT